MNTFLESGTLAKLTQKKRKYDQTTNNRNG